MIPCIDLSDNNEDDTHQIDWPTAAKWLLAWDENFIVQVKGAQGDWYRSKTYHRQRMGAHASGIKWVSLYDYLEVVSGKSGKVISGADNTRFFLDAIGADGGILDNEFLSVDVEDIAAPKGSDLLAFVFDAAETTRRALNLLSYVYSGDWYASVHNLESEPSPLDAYPKWWCVPGGNPAAPPVMPHNVKFLQVKFDLVVPGIPKPCDFSWYLGTVDELRANTWGNQTDPLAGKIIAGHPDVAINDKGEAVDANATFQRIAANLSKARASVQRGTPLDTLLATTQGDAAAGALIAGLQS